MNDIVKIFELPAEERAILLDILLYVKYLKIKNPIPLIKTEKDKKNLNNLLKKNILSVIDNKVCFSFEPQKNKEKKPLKFEMEKNLYYKKPSSLNPGDIKEWECLPQYKRIYYDYENNCWEGITQKDIDDWQSAFPNVNVLKKLNELDIWLRSGGKKTLKINFAKFIANCMLREETRGKKYV